MEQKLSGKVAIVTGGATGIGEAISKLFAQQGARVVVNGYPEDPVEAVVEEIKKYGGDAIGYAEDISLEKNAHGCVAYAVAVFGKLDILINNAGVFPVMSVIQDYPFDAFEYLVKNNMRTAFMMTRFAIPELIKTRGCIVSAGSESGKIGIAENAPYAGTKGFIHAFTRSIAVEQAKNGIRANCVCPGPIDTAWTRKEFGPMSKENEKMMISATPMGRRGTPEEIAKVYLFLASDDASYMTGALVSADGGVTIAKGAVGDMVPSELAKEPENTLPLDHSLEGATGITRGVKGSAFATSKPEEKL